MQTWIMTSCNVEYDSNERGLSTWLRLL